MSAIPAEDEQSWRAPGVGAEVGVGASPLLAGLLQRRDGVLDELHEVSLGALADGDLARLLDAATTGASRVASLECRTAAEADRRRLGEETGARHTHQWWARRSLRTRPEAARLTRLGTALESERHHPVARELAAGSLRVEQARIIVEAVHALPTHVDAQTRGRAEATLLEFATRHDARDLRRIGKRILDVVAPEVGSATRRACWRPRSPARSPGLT